MPRAPCYRGRKFARPRKGTLCSQAWHAARHRPVTRGSRGLGRQRRVPADPGPAKAVAEDGWGGLAGGPLGAGVPPLTGAQRLRPDPCATPRRGLRPSRSQVPKYGGTPAPCLASGRAAAVFGTILPKPLPLIPRVTQDTFVTKDTKLPFSARGDK